MAGRLAVDFGTSNTVVAVWDAAAGEGVPLHLPDYGRILNYRRKDEKSEQISVIPSIIHYAPGNRRWLGKQVLAQNLYDSPRTFRWMKRYISRRSPVKLRLDDREVSHFDAGRDFLSAVLAYACTTAGSSPEEVAFTVPVEAFEHYENWLAGVAESAGIPRFRLIDESSAAALGYGAFLRPGQVYLIFDLGGGTLDVSLVVMEEEGTGKRCRILGKAGTELGGATVDGWLFQEVLRQAGRGDADEDVRPLSRALLAECERAKEKLSFQDEVPITVPSPVPFTAVLTRKRLEELLDEHQAYTEIDRTVRRALNAARESGFTEDNVEAVLMVGGGSLIPSVQRLVQRIFGRDRVRLNRPLDAVARGCAAFVNGVDLYDHIQHDYAIRFVNPAQGDYEYRPLIRRGAAYPTDKPVARLTVKASHDGQTQLGLAIFEMGANQPPADNQPMELVFDPMGAARVTRVAAEDEDRRRLFWINETCPTFLEADPPATRGEARFEVEFHIDGNKRLLITARDLQTKRLTHRNFPVVKLT